VQARTAAQRPCFNPASGKIAIQADESLNALVVRADPTVMQQIRALVAQLDVRRAQILIEAAIVEVGGTTGANWACRWRPAARSPASSA
jgi:general secretion pathway protein D